MFLDGGHIDYVVKGEGDYSFPELVKALSGGDERALEAVPGLTALKDGEPWIENPRPP